MFNINFRSILPQISKSETKIHGGNVSKTHYMKRTEKAISKQCWLKAKILKKFCFIKKHRQSTKAKNRF